MQQTSETRARVIVVKPGDPMPPIVDLDEVSREGPVFEGTDVPVQYMFEYLDRVHNLHAFLDDFPEVSKGTGSEGDERAREGKKRHSQQQGLRERHPRFQGNTRTGKESV